MVFDPVSGRTQFFGEEVPKAIIAMWSVNLQTQVIGQAELLPVLWAKSTWADIVKGRGVLHFIDNDSARFALINGSSPVVASSRLASQARLADARTASYSWYARVPGCSNIADGPSRLRFSDMADYPGAVKVDIIWPDIHMLMRDHWQA